MTGRQEVLMAVSNFLYSNKYPSDAQTVNSTICDIYKFLSKPAKNWADNASWKTIWKLSGEIQSYLDKNIYLDISDFEPGGRYKK